MTDYDIQDHSQTPTGAQVSMQPQNEAQPPKGKHEKLSSVISTVAILLIAPLVAFLLTAFVFQSYQVDGPSMQTTLFNSDRLFVWKLPKTWSRITGHQYVPSRGDVIIFVKQSGSGFSDTPGKQLIKRVIGLPGERVVIKDGEVTVYNKEHTDGFKPDRTQPYGEVIKETTHDWDGVVPDNELFVLGDNRAESLDSRFFGPVPTKDVVGKLIMRVWPISQAKRF